MSPVKAPLTASRLLLRRQPNELDACGRDCLAAGASFFDLRRRMRRYSRNDVWQ